MTHWRGVLHMSKAKWEAHTVNSQDKCPVLPCELTSSSPDAMWTIRRCPPPTAPIFNTFVRVKGNNATEEEDAKNLDIMAIIV